MCFFQPCNCLLKALIPPSRSRFRPQSRSQSSIIIYTQGCLSFSQYYSGFWHFSKLLEAICVRPNPCNQKPLPRNPSVSVSILSSGHVWTLIYISLQSFTQRDILQWNQRVMTHAIYMQPRFSELDRLVRLCISYPSHWNLGVADA